MLNNNTYHNLIKLGIFQKVNADNTKLYENDIVINDENANIDRKYKVETNGMSNEEIMITLLTRQTMYLKRISYIVIICFIFGLLTLIAFGR